MAMNTGKVVVGGLVAGLVLNVGDYIINTMVVAAENAAFLQRVGIDPASLQSASAMAPWIVINFLFGLLVVWTYAAIRPRFGPGVGTAIIAGLIPYLGATLVLAGFASMGIFPTAALLKGSIASLVNTSIAAIAGAWLYTES